MKKRPLGVKSVETKYMEERAELFRALKSLDRRSFVKVSAAAFGAVMAQGLTNPHSFQPVSVAFGAEGEKKPAEKAKPEGFRFAYISDAHLYERKLNDRFVNALLRAVDDVNALDPQPDFVLFGGDLAQLGQAVELELGAQILKNVKAPLHMMAGEHDWYLDLGAKWRELFGKDVYSFDHKGAHCVVLNSIIEEDFWTKRGLSPMQRMRIVAGLDNGIQNRFTVGAEQRKWLAEDLAKVPVTTPIIVFSHSPLYKLYKPWNFWTDDADEVQAILKRFPKVTVFHGHTHQVLTNRIGNINFHGFLATAWPWPYAPEGLPEMTVQMGRPDPFNPNDGCGNGYGIIHPDGLADKVYNLWNRNPVTIKASYMTSRGKQDRPDLAKAQGY